MFRPQNGCVPQLRSSFFPPMKFADAPRLPKLPFLLGDLALLLLAGVIATHHPNPLAPLPLLTITACVAVGALASFVPFLVNYARDQEEVSAALRGELGEQFKRLMAASEHLQHATVQLKTVEEIATKNLQAAEKLPYHLQEKIAEFNQQLAETENEETNDGFEHKIYLRRGHSPPAFGAAAASFSGCNAARGKPSAIMAAIRANAKVPQRQPASPAH